MLPPQTGRLVSAKYFGETQFWKVRCGCVEPSFKSCKIWPAKNQLQTTHQDILRAGTSYLLWLLHCSRGCWVLCVFSLSNLAYFSCFFYCPKRWWVFSISEWCIRQVCQLQFRLNLIWKRIVLSEWFLEVSETQGWKGWWGLLGETGLICTAHPR